MGDREPSLKYDYFRRKERQLLRDILTTMTDTHKAGTQQIFYFLNQFNCKNQTSIESLLSEV